MIRRGLFGVLVAVFALGALVSSAAAAGTPVKQEIEIQLQTIRANPEFKSLQKFKVENAAEARKAIPKIDALKAVYARAAAAVAKSSATTTAEKTARTDWISAVKLNVTGIGDLATGLRDYANGDKAEADTEIDKGVKLDASANQESVKAYKLLGIPLAG